MKEYHIYSLVKDGKSVYIGYTNHLANRIRTHRNHKAFDTYQVIESFNSKEDALIGERCIIKFLSMFSDGLLYNAKYVNLELKKPYLKL